MHTEGTIVAATVRVEVLSLLRARKSLSQAEILRVLAHHPPQRVANMLARLRTTGEVVRIARATYTLHSQAAVPLTDKERVILALLDRPRTCAQVSRAAGVTRVRAWQILTYLRTQGHIEPAQLQPAPRQIHKGAAFARAETPRRLQAAAMTAILGFCIFSGAPARADFQLIATPSAQASAAPAVNRALSDSRRIPPPSVNTAFPAALGFGRRIPLATAVRQIVPRGIQVSYENHVDKNALIDWSGGRAWNEVLQTTVSQLGLGAVATPDRVIITARP